jgi:hypothetical protein
MTLIEILRMESLQIDFGQIRMKSYNRSELKNRRENQNETRR